MERRLIGERTRVALQHKKSNGEKTGGDIPFGYNQDAEGRLIKNGYEQRAISLIIDLRCKGRSLRAICEALKAKGVRTKRGCLTWHPQSIKQILGLPVVSTAPSSST